MPQDLRKTPKQIDREVTHQLRYQQRKLVGRALKASGYNTRAALEAEARRLFRMPMTELNRLMMGADVALVARLVKR